MFILKITSNYQILINKKKKKLIYLHKKKKNKLEKHLKIVECFYYNQYMFWNWERGGVK